MENQETLTDICEELRSGEYAPLADRIEAARKREDGNAAALREALANLVDVIDRYDSGSPLWWHCGAKGVKPLKDAKAALSAPPRNCDLYATPDAAELAFDDYCHDRRENPTEVCRRKSCRDCQREWLYAGGQRTGGGVNA
jgi:hypothetical protein